MPGSWEDVRKALEDEPVKDILVPGFVTYAEREPQFRPVPYSVYLKLGSGYLRMDTVGQFDQLHLRVVPEVAFGEIEVDEEDTPMLGSFGDLFLTGEPGDEHCSAFRYWTDPRSDLGTAKVKCLELEIARHDIVFVDPTWHSGIRLGTAEHARKWRKDYFDPGQGMHEHGWRRE